MFIHIAPQTWQGRETDDVFHAARGDDPRQARHRSAVTVAESMGARYIVFVAKHEGGFCWWQTATTDWSVATCRGEMARPTCSANSPSRVVDAT
jgi:alpha-L-fucosidase